MFWLGDVATLIFLNKFRIEKSVGEKIQAQSHQNNRCAEQALPAFLSKAMFISNSDKSVFCIHLCNRYSLLVFIQQCCTPLDFFVIAFLSTRIGMSVNAIRKQSTDEEVTSLAKSLIKSWKKLLNGPSTDKDPEEKKKDAAVTSQNSPKAREESSSSGNISSRKDETNAQETYVSSFPQAPGTSDSVRLKCRERLAAALRTGDDYIAIGADEEELGCQIEEDILCVYTHNCFK
ncbi:Transcription elongation factor A protein 1 [Manis javanica]|nr:Transcription elongation factor A protein 1 [Manis javanica]